MRKLLALLPSAQDRAELARLVEEGIHVVFAEDDGWKSYEVCPDGFDPVSYTERAILLGRQEQVDGVFYTDDLANFVAAVVCRELALPGPSVDSMFLANHKYYARRAERSPIAFSGHTIGESFDAAQVSLPSQLKPTSLYFSLLQFTARSTEEVSAAAASLARDVPKWERPFKDLFASYVDRERYPLANRDMFLAEEFVSARSHHAVEGWTGADGRLQLWAVSDNNYFDGPGSALDNNAFPSRLSETVKAQVIECAFNAVRDMGIKTGFWNVEVWVLDNGTTRVTEVNGRACVSMTALYRAVSGQSQYPLVAKLSAGQLFEPSELVAPAGRVGGMFAISTASEGIVRDLLDLDAYERMKQAEDVVRTTLVFSPDTSIEWKQTGGRCCLARAWIVGSSYEEIRARAEGFRRQLLRSEAV